jgi:hypothetical protein
MVIIVLVVIMRLLYRSKKSKDEIFTLKDKVKNSKNEIVIINTFYYQEWEDNKIDVFCNITTGEYNMMNMNKLKYIFITEDGRETFKEDTLYVVHTLTYDSFKTIINDEFLPINDFKYFSSKEFAENYIKENKPKFSEKQILNAIEKYKLCPLPNSILFSELKKELGI